MLLVGAGMVIAALALYFLLRALSRSRLTGSGVAWVSFYLCNTIYRRQRRLFYLSDQDFWGPIWPAYSCWC